MKPKLAFIAAALAAAVPMFAHHSFSAEFDAQKRVNLKGTVVKVEWMNPHIWIYLDVKDANGTGCASNSWAEVAPFLFWVDNLNVYKHSDGGVVDQSLQELELRRKNLFRQLQNLGDFRRGTISVNYRKCGKSNCACARKDHPGHGPQYLWNVSIGGRTQARNLPLGPELEKIEKEVDRYHTFVRLSQELIEVNDRICQLRPVRSIENENELDQLKKKLRRHFAEKRKRK
jgi:Family of unknown function (DUF6152)